MAGIDLSFCASVWAFSDAWHVRLLAPGEPKIFHGGLTLQALCGQEVAWDIDTDVTFDLAIDSNYTCASCRAALELLRSDQSVLSQP